MTDVRVAISRPLPGDPAAQVRAAGFTNVIANERDEQLDSKALRELVAGAHGVLTTPVDRVDAAFFDAAGPHLRIVSNFAVGFDNIDTSEAKRRGVSVGNTPEAVTEPTADMAWLLLLAAARRAREGMELVLSGGWRGVGPNELLGTRIVGKTLFIVGAGRIGFATARRAVGWEMRILYHARSAHTEFEEPPLRASRVTLEDGLREADFVSIHVPLTAETRHLINRERLGMMKREAILINTARGAVIDEESLVAALREKRIAAAGLDVYEREPHLHPGLADLPNVFLMPHLGSSTVEDREWMTDLAVKNLVAGLRGEPVPHRVV